MSMILTDATVPSQVPNFGSPMEDDSSLKWELGKSMVPGATWGPSGVLQECLIDDLRVAQQEHRGLGSSPDW